MLKSSTAQNIDTTKKVVSQVYALDSKFMS